MLAFHSGSSAAIDSGQAMTECLSRALGEDHTCDLIIFYTTMGHNFSELLGEARRQCPGAEIVGSGCSGVIGREGPNESMRALAIMAIRGPRDEFTVAGLDSIVDREPRAAAIDLAKELKRGNPNVRFVLFHPSLLDILPSDEALRGFESVLPHAAVIGGLSIDAMNFVSTFQFLGDQVFERGAVAVGFSDPTLELVAMANHGFQPIGEPFVVTRVADTRVLELDGQPAWKSLTQRLGLPETVAMTEIAAYAVLGEELPPEEQEEYGNRCIIRGGPLKDAEGALQLMALTSLGTKLWIMKRDEEGIFRGVDHLLERVLDRCGGRRPVAVFHADCEARGRLMLDRIQKDEIIHRIQQPFFRDGELPWLGMYGGGELATLGGQNHIHIFTTSLYVLLRDNDGPGEER